MIELQPGDIFATKGHGLVGWLTRKFMEPETDRYHYGIILLKWQDDYLILEALKKGISVTRLSDYKGADIKFYRVNCLRGLRVAAPFELTRWGRCNYGWWQIIKLIIQGFALLGKHLVLEGRLGGIRAEEFTWNKDDSPVCSRAVDIAYDAVGVNIIPIHVCPTPSAFRQAEIDGRIEEIKEVFSG